MPSCDRTCALLVEAGEGVADDVLGVGAVELLSEHGEEHGEVDGPGRFGHHGLQVLVGRVLTCGSRTAVKPQPVTGVLNTKPNFYTETRTLF